MQKTLKYINSRVGPRIKQELNNRLNPEIDNPTISGVDERRYCPRWSRDEGFMEIFIPSVARYRYRRCYPNPTDQPTLRSLAYNFAGMFALGKRRKSGVEGRVASDLPACGATGAEEKRRKIMAVALGTRSMARVLAVGDHDEEAGLMPFSCQ